MQEYLITVSGELPLRSNRTRPKFYSFLIKNINDAVSKQGIKVLESKIIGAKVLFVTDKEALPYISKVFGVHRVAKVLVYRFRDLQDLSRWIFENAKDAVMGKKFAIKVKRSGAHNFKSIDVAREVGALLKPFSGGVDLNRPEVRVEIEIYEDTAFLYKDSKSGPGGLPIGVEGKALVLFSGGFDSPVAAWLTAKRGIQVDFLHCLMGTSQMLYFPFLVAKKLASEWLHGYRPKFVIVDFRDIIKEISEKVDWSYRQVVLRALMYITSSKLAKSMNYDAIVTGESIGQTSSQTLKNISSIEVAIRPSLPILRPLISYDKEEIIKISRDLGLFDLSSKVEEPCAIAPSRVATSTTPVQLIEQLNRIDQSVIDKAVSSIKVINVYEAEPQDVIISDDIELDFIPDGALIVDARSMPNKGGDLKDAIPVNQLDPSRLPKDRVIVVVCETGNVSYIIAKTLRDSGFKAYSLRGGLKGCPIH